MKKLAGITYHICRRLARRRIKSGLSRDCVYLTFDDGPEPGVTEFVLDELRKHGAKATFFCCGKNCVSHDGLLMRIKDEGHVVANHTYSHIKGLSTNDKTYIADVERGAEATGSCLFRPPWGGATLKQYLKLRRKHTFVYWDVVSGDTQMEAFNLEANMNRLKTTELGGRIVLLHFCKQHENETRQILPPLLDYIDSVGLRYDTIKIGNR